MALHENRQVEIGVALSGRWHKKVGIGQIAIGKISHELFANLIRAERNSWPYNSADARRCRAYVHHGIDASLEDIVERPAPSGMGGTNDTGLRVGQQHGRAIGGENAQANARLVAHQRISFNCEHIVLCVFDINGLCAVNLMRGDKHARAQMRAYAAAVFSDRGGLILRPASGVQAFIYPRRHPAKAGEKPVRLRVQAVMCEGL